MSSARLCFQAPPLSYLSPAQMQQIHATALAILNTVGSRIHDPDSVRLLKDHGASTDIDGRVLIPEPLVMQCVASAPARVLIYDRNREPAMDLSSTHVYFGSGSDCQYLLDPDTRQPRDFLYRDVSDAVRLADCLHYIDFVMCMGLAPDLEPAQAFQRKYLAMVRNTVKPLILISGPDAKSLTDIVEMASIVAGDRKCLAAFPSFLLLIDPTSPLVHTRDALEKLRIMARENLPVVYAPGIMAGASSPVTVAGAVAQAAAEILAGLVVHQLTSPGAPFIFGGGMSPMDMSSGQPTYSAPEAMVAQAGLTQLGRDFYRLPTYGFGGCTASKTCDAQAVNEASTYLMMSAFMGTNLVHDVGYTEFGRTFSLELLVLCNETCGQIRRMMEGIPVDDDSLGLDALRRVGPGGTFLTDPHTMAHFRQNWQPDLTDRRTRSVWEKRGSTTMEERAIERVRSILASYSSQPLPSEIDLALNRFLES